MPSPNNKFLILFLIPFFILTSCSKDDDSLNDSSSSYISNDMDVEPSKTTCRILKQYDDGNLLASYDRISETRIRKDVYYGDTVVYISYIYDKDEFGRLHKHQSFDKGGVLQYELEYIYESDTPYLSKSIYRNTASGSLAIVSSAEYSYDRDADCKLTQIDYFDESNNKFSTQAMEYLDENCSREVKVSEISISTGEATLKSHFTTTFDSFSHPEEDFSAGFQTVHNQLTYVNKLDGDLLTFEADISYNEHGYPLIRRITTLATDGSQRIREYTYEYECD